MGLVPSCTAATAVAAITAVVGAVPVPLASTALAALRQRLLQSVHQALLEVCLSNRTFVGKVCIIFLCVTNVSVQTLNHYC
jgi:hypothetical protein